MQFNSKTKRVKLTAYERRSMKSAADSCALLGRLFDDDRGQMANVSAKNLTLLLEAAEEPEPELTAVG